MEHWTEECKTFSLTEFCIYFCVINVQLIFNVQDTYILPVFDIMFTLFSGRHSQKGIGDQRIGKIFTEGKYSDERENKATPGAYPTKAT
jgi:hypothetical protein